MLMRLGDTEKRQSEFQVSSILAKYQYNAKLNQYRYLKTKSKRVTIVFV